MRTTIREPLSSSDARAAILSSCEALRGLAAATIEVTEAGAWSRAERDFEPVRAQARHLCAAVCQHMEFEERILATALGDVIGWGRALRSQIEDDHARQRETIVLAMSAMEPHAVASERLLERVRALADALLVDLESEERYLLTAEIDALSADSHGG